MNTRLGKYLLRRRLGTGGMGEVWEALDTVLGRPVAVKLLTGDGADTREAVREAAAAARVNHPNAVSVYDAAECDGRWLIVMELVDGPSALKLVEERGPLPWAEATRITRDAAAGLAAVHAAGLIHRDVKPANILLTRDGTAKVADFGLARTSSRSTVTSVVGTPHYMSPEQCWNETADGRADVYSLGATYFTLLTSRPPFAGDTPMAVMYAHCHSPVPDPREVCAGVPAGCAAVARRAMAKAPADRFASANEIRAALDAVLAGAAVSESDNDTRSVRLPPNTLAAPPLRRPFPTRRVAVTAGVGALAAAALTTLACWPRPGITPPTTTPHTTPTAPPDDEPDWGTLPPFDGAVKQIAFSPDGRTVAVAVTRQLPGGNKEVTGDLHLVTRDGKPLPGWPKLVGTADGVAFTTDGKAVAVALRQSGAVQVYAVADGKPVPVEAEELPEAFSVQFSDDGEWMAAAGFSGETALVRFWQWDAKRRWVARSRGVAPASWSWGGRFVPGCNVVAVIVGVGPRDNMRAAVRLFDAATGREVDGPRGELEWKGLRPTLAFAATAPLMAVSTLGEVRLFRVPDWQAVGVPLALTLDRTKKDLNALAVSPDGKWVAGGRDVDIHLWRTEDGVTVRHGRKSGQAPSPDLHIGTVNTLAFTPDGKRLLSGGDDGKVIVHDHAELFRRPREKGP